MKRIISILSLTFVLGTASFAQNDGESRAIAAARSAIANDCLAGISSIKTSVSVNYDCNIFDAEGQNRTVYFYSTPNCPPNQYCIQRIAPLAKVVVDCDFEIESIECYKEVYY